MRGEEGKRAGKTGWGMEEVDGMGNGREMDEVEVSHLAYRLWE
jgi:hypothetical protein